MLTKDDIESFLVRLAATGATYSEVEPGFWIVRPNADSDLSVAVNFSPPVLLLRVDVMTLPKDGAQSATLTRRLLELNATDLLHGSSASRTSRSSSPRRSSCRRSTSRSSLRATRA